MCGLLAIFPKSLSSRTAEELQRHLLKQSWRGPDHLGIWVDEQKRALLGHNRLTILDDSQMANMPMESICGRYTIIYNGEIYNHLELRSKFELNHKTHSDTETIVNLYAKIGSACVKHLDGMFSFVIFDKLSGGFFAARDQLGIKPLYYSNSNKEIIFCSESPVINDLIISTPSVTSIEEWKVFRRPLGNKTFFEKIYEIPPGHFYKSDEGLKKYWSLTSSDKPFDQEEFEEILFASVKSNLMNDYKSVSLLSGGLDSAVILGISEIKKSYTVGIPGNNEFEGAEDSASHLSTDLVKINITKEELVSAWRSLLACRREPLSVPNEGLIFSVCNRMEEDEKVVLTGEGADELLFGYDRIFQWAYNQKSIKINDFLNKYSYSNSELLHVESLDCISEMMSDKSPIEFMEDFFIHIHLPGLLRRMDAASMCASKEARVPFVNPKLFNLLYRKPFEFRFGDGFAKTPLRKIAANLGLNGSLSRKKIGFSASLTASTQRDEYAFFQKFCLTELDWI